MPTTTLVELFERIDTVCEESAKVTAACLATLHDADEISRTFWTTDGEWIGDIFVPSSAAVAAMPQVA